MTYICKFNYVKSFNESHFHQLQQTNSMYVCASTVLRGGKLIECKEYSRMMLLM